MEPNQELNAWLPLSKFKDFGFSWRDNRGLKTIIMYDEDAPSHKRPTNSPFLHMLTVNTSGKEMGDGIDIIDYRDPSPSRTSGQHRYHFIVLSQRGKFDVEELKEEVDDKRARFDVDKFIHDHSLNMVGELMLVLDAGTDEYMIEGPGVNEERPIIIADTDLPEDKQKYCSCVIQVAAKQTESCLRDKAWKQTVDGKTCTSPYAVCAKSVGTTSRKCYENYFYDKFTDQQLRAFAASVDLDIPKPYNREKLLNKIHALRK